MLLRVFSALFMIAFSLSSEATIFKSVRLLDESELKYDPAVFEITDGTAVFGTPLFILKLKKFPKETATLSTEFSPVVFQKQQVASNWCLPQNLKEAMCVEKVNSAQEVTYTLRTKAPHLLRKSIEVVHSVAFKLNNKNQMQNAESELLRSYSELLKGIVWVKP
jgi:hypothetical protein